MCHHTYLSHNMSLPRPRSKHSSLTLVSHHAAIHFCYMVVFHSNGTHIDHHSTLSPIYPSYEFVSRRYHTRVYTRSTQTTLSLRSSGEEVEEVVIFFVFAAMRELHVDTIPS